MPTITAPAVAQARSIDRRVVRRLPAFEDARRARSGDAARAHVVLDRDRHAGERTLVTRRCRPRRPPRRASSASTRLNVCTSPSRASMRARCSSSTSRACRRPTRTSAAIDAAVRSRRLTQDARHPEPSVFRRRRGREHLVARQARRDHVGTQHVHERQRMRGRRHVGVSSAETSAAWSRIAPSSRRERVELGRRARRQASQPRPRVRPRRRVMRVGHGGRTYLYGSSG